MTDFNSSIVSAQIREASNVLLWLSFGIYFSDTLSFVKWDLSLFNTKKTFKWSHIPYILSKLGVWVYFFTQIAVRWTEKEVDCGAALYGLEFLSAFCIVSSSVVLAHRSIQLFKDRVQRNVSILLSILLLILVVAWILSIQDIKSHWDIKSGQIWQDGACQIDRVEAAFPTKFGLTLLFLLVLIGLAMFSQRSTSMESENGATSTLSLTALSILDLVILILSARNLNSQLDVLFQIPFIVAYNMVAIRSHFNLCSRTEIPNTSKIIAQMNHSQLTFESNKVENGCRSPAIIQMEVDRSFTRVEDSSSYENEKSVRLSIPSSNSKGLGINDQKSQQSQTQSPTRSNFTRTSNSTSVRSKVSHSRSAIYIVDDLALENETQMQLESTPPPKNRSLIPFKYSSPQKFVTSSSLSVSPSPSSKRCSTVEPKRSLQDPWNQVEPSPSLSPFPSNSINQMMSTSTPPLKVSPKNPLRSKPYANKSKRPLTPKKRKDKEQEQEQERPNTANSYTQKMAIALEFNSRSSS